jgi:hypothetical protein
MGGGEVVIPGDIEGGEPGTRNYGVGAAVHYCIIHKSHSGEGRSGLGQAYLKSSIQSSHLNRLTRSWATWTSAMRPV